MSVTNRIGSHRAIIICCGRSRHSTIQNNYEIDSRANAFWGRCAGIYGDYVDTGKISDLDKLKTFDEHAIFYTLNPDLWNTLPLFALKHKISKPTLYGKSRSIDESLEIIRKKLKLHNIRLYYRDLTTIDVQQLGLSVVRVASPDLAQIFAHQEWPLINKVDKLLASRYPKAKKLVKFPNLMPHPLG